LYGERRCITGLRSGGHIASCWIDDYRIRLATYFVGLAADGLAVGDGVAKRTKMLGEQRDLRRRALSGIRTSPSEPAL
jgi:hypothetical protein